MKEHGIDFNSRVRHRHKSLSCDNLAELRALSMRGL